MASLVAIAAHTSRFSSSTVAGIWRSVGVSLSSSLVPYRSYSNEEVDGRGLLTPSAAADPLSRKFPRAVTTAHTFGTARPVYGSDEYPPRKCDGFRVYRPIRKLSLTAWNVEEHPVRNCIRASGNVAQDPCHDSPKQGFPSGKELPIGSASGRGNMHLVSASITSDGFAIRKRCQQKDLSVESYMFVEILKWCSMQKDLIATRQVHEYIIQSGLQKHQYVATSLLNVYIKCGQLQDAQRVFDGLAIPNRNVKTWTAMIGAYAKSGCGVEAYRLFHQMTREGFKPDAFTYVSILNASGSAGALEWVKEVHSHALKAGLESNLLLGNALVHRYAKSGSIDDARLVFDRMEERDVVTWNTMIGAYAKRGSGIEAYRLFHQMKREGIKADVITYVNILNESASAGALEWVKEIHSHAVKAGLASDLRVGTALVHMYAKCGSIDEARLIFDRMKGRDVVTFNVMIGGLAEHGCGHEALTVFRKMIAEGVKPDGTSLVAVLSGCCHAGLVEHGRRIFSSMVDYGIEPDLLHYTCMVDLLGRAGHLEEAKLFIGEMPVEPDGVTWGTLLAACRTYGNVELGELAAQEVLKLEPEDAGAYVLLSNIYAAAGKWEKMSSVRTMMDERGVRKEKGRSWIEVDYKIHEFVVGDTSHPEAKAIYAELSKLSDKLRAEGYVPDTQLVLHNIDEEDKILALCCHSEKLAIAYGLMRTPRGNPIRVFKNLRVCSDCHTATKHIAKVTGREIIARDAHRFHHFKDGMCSCGDFW